MKSNSRRRQMEEIMLNLLLKQYTESDINDIIRINSDPFFPQANIDLHRNYKKHIEPYCKANSSLILSFIKDDKLRDAFNSAFSFLPISSDPKDIRKFFMEYLTGIKKGEMVPEEILLNYLSTIDYESLKGMRLALNILINGHEKNEGRIIEFINRVFVKRKAKQQKAEVVLRFIDEIYSFFDGNKRERLIRLLYRENEKNGTPGVIASSPSIQEKNFIVMIEIERLQCSFNVVSHFRLPSYTTLYELLTLIMIDNRINIDLFNFQHNSKIIDISRSNYLSSLYALFNFSAFEKGEGTIKLTLSPIVQFEEEELYFAQNSSNLKDSIKNQLNELFDSTSSIHIDNLFSHVYHDKFKEDMKKVLFKTEKRIDFPSFICSLQKKTKECIELLNLMIGFYDGDTNRPYLRNIIKSNMIGYELVKHEKHFEDNEKHLISYYRFNFIESPLSKSSTGHLHSIFRCDYSNEFNVEDIQLFSEGNLYSNETTSLENKNNIKSDYLTNVLKGWAEKIEERFSFEQYNIGIVEALIETKEMKIIDELIQISRNFDLFFILTAKISPTLISIFDQITQLEIDRIYSVDYFSSFYGIEMKEPLTPEVLRQFVDFFFPMIDHFLKWPLKYKALTENKQFHQLLVRLLENETIASDKEARKHSILLSFSKYNDIKPRFHSDIAKVISSPDYIIGKLNPDSKSLMLSIVEEKESNFPHLKLPNEISQNTGIHWRLSSILIQLLHLHQYRPFSRTNDLTIFGFSLYDLISSKEKWDNVYLKFDAFAKKNKSDNYKLITEILNQKNLKTASTQEKETKNAFYILETLEEKIKHQLIGCIIILNNYRNGIESFCCNITNQSEVHQYTYNPSKTQIEISDLTQIQFLSKVMENTQIKKWCLYLNTDFQQQSKHIDINALFAHFQEDEYPFVYLILFSKAGNLNENALGLINDSYGEFIKSKRLLPPFIESLAQDNRIDPKLKRCLGTLLSNC